MVLSNCGICGKKRSTFITIKEPHNFDQFKTNQIISKVLLTGDKFMTELHFKQPRFTYSACEQFTKHRERIQKFRETGNLKYLYRNGVDKTSFARDAVILIVEI